MEGNVFSSLKYPFCLWKGIVFSFTKILSANGKECCGGGKLYILDYKGCGYVVVKGVYKRLVAL